MGCTPSKETVRRRRSRESWSGLVSRSASAPIHYCHPAENEENDAGHVVSLIASSYGALKVERRGDLIATASFARLLQRKFDGVEDPLHARQLSECHGSNFKLDTVHERAESMETINIWELMEGLDEGEVATAGHGGSVEEEREMRSCSSGSSIEEDGHVDGSSSNRHEVVDEKRGSSSSIEEDGHFDGSSSNRHEVVDEKAGNSSRVPVGRTSPNGNLDALFDPATMAKFEHALSTIAVTQDGCWRLESQAQQQCCCSSTSASSSSQTWASTAEASSDAESRETEEETTCRAELEGNAGKADMDLGQAKEEGRTEDYRLEEFEWRCPPRGGERRVVVYVTSLRGVRKTYEDCCDVRMILQGLNVRVDERDVWMHSRYRDELAELVMAGHGDNDVTHHDGYQVPRLFIKGRYIGGSDQVRHLHEHGSLIRLLADVPPLGIPSICSACGGFRFIPCLSCNGSCKLLPNSDVAAVSSHCFPTRCPHCNENGLMMCPLCN